MLGKVCDFLKYTSSQPNKSENIALNIKRLLANERVFPFETIVAFMTKDYVRKFRRKTEREAEKREQYGPETWLQKKANEHL